MSLPPSRTDKGASVNVTVTDRDASGEQYDLMLSKAA